jgi:polar amino acid transport system substrate-binding protein
MSPSIPPTVLHDLAPTGKVRAAINVGNAVLAQRDATTGQPKGVSIDLARELGRRLGVGVELVPFDAAGKVFAALATGAWDVAFLAIDPQRAAEIAFTAPYVIIEGAYMVRGDSPLRANADVDRPGVRVAVGRGSAYELYLTRTLKHAELVRMPTGSEAMAAFDRDRLDAVAGIRSPLVAHAAQHPGLRVLDGRFMAIEQALGTPKDRAAGANYLRLLVEALKASGFVADALARHGQRDAQVAPTAAQ